MSEATLTRADIEALAKFDTASVCNALEVLRPEYRSTGFTKLPLIAARPGLPPVVGVARVGRIRAAEPPRGRVPDRVNWYEYVARADVPTMVVIQDVDDVPGTGSFWGEVHSEVHKALGAAGCVTNGSYRDTELLAKGFQILGGRVGPSHAHVHLVEFGEPVEVCGMPVAHGDIVHADYQGAVVIPGDCVDKGDSLRIPTRCPWRRARQEQEVIALILLEKLVSEKPKILPVSFKGSAEGRCGTDNHV